MQPNGRKVRSIVSFDRGSGRIVSLVNGDRSTYELVGDELIYTYTSFIYNKTRVQTFQKKLPTGWKEIKAWLGNEKKSLFLSPLGKRFPSREEAKAFITKGESGSSSKRVKTENDTPLVLTEEEVKMKKKRRSEKNYLNLREHILEQGWILGTKKSYLKMKEENALKKAQRNRKTKKDVKTLRKVLRL